jgi:mono/diheme cytochrome c family protein
MSAGVRAPAMAPLALLGASLLRASLCHAADSPTPQYPEGANAFSSNCAVCHGAAGAGQPALAPPLLANPARYASVAEGRRQLALTVLFGMFGDITVEQKHYNFKMPEFSQQSDATLSAVLNFVVFDLARAPADTRPMEPAEIAAERGAALDGAAVREHRASVLAGLGGG